MQKPEVILCDIDGTVANCEHRKHFIDDELRVGDFITAANIPNAKAYRGKIVGRKTYNFVVEWDTMPDMWRGSNKVYTGSPLRFIRKVKNYKKFFEAAKDDSPIQDTIDIIIALREASYPVIFCSGRPETYCAITTDFIEKHILAHWGTHDKLFMRPAGDMREDYIVKEELYRKYIEPHYTVKCVFDDRDKVVKMWRRLGLTCYQVAEGNF